MHTELLDVSNYDHFSLFVSGLCKSAGLLVAIGENELIISDRGELGPLDVQISKRDEMGEFESGITSTDSLTTLQQKAFATFEEFYISIKATSHGSISLKMATKLATDLTIGLFTPIQLDPLNLTEFARAKRIVRAYGERLFDRRQIIRSPNHFEY